MARLTTPPPAKTTLTDADLDAAAQAAANGAARLDVATEIPPTTDIPPATPADRDRVNTALAAMRGLMRGVLSGNPERPDAPKGKPAGPSRPPGKRPARPAGHPAEAPTARPPAPAPDVKPGKPGKDVKNGAPANEPRTAADPGQTAPGGRKRPATRSAGRNGHILPRPTTTTGRAYHGLDSAYRYFNRALFKNRLPDVVITLQRAKGKAGYFARGRFADVAADVSKAGARISRAKKAAKTVDEIAMNPATFTGRTVMHVLSTLVHEMTHVEQNHFGTPSRGGYHNHEWAQLMAQVGLVASATGEKGGKMTGQRMSHYVVKGGAFDTACKAFFKAGGKVTLFGDKWMSDSDVKLAKQKTASKTKYTCPSCEMNAWAKPDVRLVCGECDEELEAAPAKD